MDRRNFTKALLASCAVTALSVPRIARAKPKASIGRGASLSMAGADGEYHKIGDVPEINFPNVASSSDVERRANLNLHEAMGISTP